MSRNEKIEALTRAFLQLKRSMNKQLAESDACMATPVQIEILSLILSGEDKLADIAEKIQTSPSAVTQQVNQLAELGFVEKTRSNKDRRETPLALTAAGKQAINAKKELMRLRIEQLVNNLSDDELEQFTIISNKIAMTGEK